MYFILNVFQWESSQWNPTCRMRDTKLQRKLADKQKVFPSYVLPLPPQRLRNTSAMPPTPSLITVAESAAAAATDLQTTFWFTPTQKAEKLWCLNTETRQFLQ